MKAYFPFLLAAGLAATVMGWLPRSGAVGERPSVSVFEKSAPQDLSDLRAIEQAAREVVESVLPCTVSLHVGPAQGSGVIVSEDGYILTAAHVVGRPGSEVKIRLTDGTVLDGITLGMQMDVDAGMVKITDEGKWPFVELVPVDEGPEAGEWCVATGHPGGFQDDRTPPVRVGRVVDVTKDVIRTDCLIMGGDSGGPLFDMQGRVIGIHSRISQDLTINLHAPALACIAAWNRLQDSEIFPQPPASHFLGRLDADEDGAISRVEQPNDLYRGVFDRLAEKYELDPDESHQIEELTKRWNWRRSNRNFGRPYSEEERVGESLMKELFVRGDDVLKAFEELAADARRSTVEVSSGGRPVALGTIVAADGWILTKASDLADRIRCRFHDGRRADATLMGVDEDYDVALLRVEKKDLRPVEFAEADLPKGSWILSPDRRGIASVGVLSVGQRHVVQTPGVLGVQIVPNVPEARILDVVANSGAAAAGMQVNDVITHVNDTAVASFEELVGVLKDFRADDVVKVRVVRDEAELEFTITLGAREDVFFRGLSRASGPVSRRRDGFPQAFQHDSVLNPAKCGGPVVDSRGRVIGMNISRTDRIATYSLPSKAIKPVLAKLRAAATSTTSNR